MADHPCLTCGACCAYYRVGFYWREAEEGAHPVPLELTEDYSPHLRAMKGTNQKHHVRCVALEGKVGAQVACSIYLSRPTPCRAFTASFEDGVHQPRCDEARARYGLKPLRHSDWLRAFPRGDSAATIEGNETLEDRPGP